MRFAIVPALVAGLAAPAAADTILHLSETGRVMVRADEVSATLRAEAAAPGAEAAQAQINAMMGRALALARQASGVRVSTGTYEVAQQSIPGGGNRPVRTEWRGSQTLELQSGDGPVMLALVGRLQSDGLAVSRLAWDVSEEAARRARTEATRQALSGLRAAAEAAADTLGLRFHGFREIRLESARPMPVAQALAAAMPASMPAPSAATEDVPVDAVAQGEAVLVMPMN